jgi:hypothetical protein
LLVNVPVLSMQSTLTAAIASTAFRRCTTAPRAVMRTAPRVKANVAINTRPCGTMAVMVAAIICTSWVSGKPRRKYSTT